MKRQFKKGDIVGFGTDGRIALIDKVVDPDLYWAYFDSTPLTPIGNLQGYGLIHDGYFPVTFICKL